MNSTNPRLDALVANYAMARPVNDDATALYWQAVVNAWLLCGIVRIRSNASDEFAVAILNDSASIVWC